MAEMISLRNQNNATEAGVKGGVSFKVSGGSATEDISITYTVTGTATMGSDYFGGLEWSGSTTIWAGTDSTRLILDPINDFVVEGDESVIVTITSVNGLSGGMYDIDNTRESATLWVIDNDNEIGAFSTGTQASEPNSPIVVKFGFLNGLSASEDITINYSAIGTTAQPEDIAVSGGTVVLPAGQNNVIVTIPVVDDKLIEGSQSVRVSITGVSAPTLQVRVAASSAINSSILDDDIELSIAVNNIIHGGENPNMPGRFTITLPPDVITTKSIRVNYSVSGTATNGLDYTALTGSATIAPSKGNVNVIIFVTDDKVIEDLENIVVTLTSGTIPGEINFSIHPTEGTAIINITDDDNVPANRVINAVKVNDGSETAGDGSFKLALPPFPSSPGYSFKQDMTVTYTVSGTATPGADYTALSGTATLVAGQNSVLVPIPVKNDALIEGDESVIITPLAVTAGGDSFTAGAKDTIMIIDDDDDNLKVGISTYDRFAGEAGDTAAFRVSVPNGVVASTPITVTYDIDGIAENGVDLVTLTGTVVIPPDSNGVFIPVRALDDNLVEGDELLAVQLTGVTSSLPFTIDTGKDTATVVILDDDNINMDIVAGVSGAIAAEPSTPGVFTVGLASGKTTSVPVTLTYQVAGTATTDVDYTALSGTVTIPAGSSSATIEVPVLDDDLIEGDETIALTLDGVTAGLPFVIGAHDKDTVRINDDDDVNMNVVINASIPNAGEPSTPGEFTVSLASGKTPLAPITVTYTVSGSATAGTDYTALSGTVTIPAGSSSVTFPVPVLNDTIAETNESVIVQLNTITAAMPFVKGAPDKDTVIIMDDDTEQVVISASDADAAEPSNGGQFTISIASGKPVEADVTITLEVTGTATNGTDYTAIPLTMVLPAGNSSITIPLSVLDDDLIEGDETVSVQLMNLASTVLYNIGGNNMATITIGDEDDDNLNLEIVATKPQAAEPGTEPGNEGEFTIRLESGKAPGEDITVDLNISGSATMGTDYDAIPTSVVIPAGSSSVVIPIQVQDDPKPEGMESIMVTLTNASGGGMPFTLGANSLATVELLDNDTALTAAWMSTHTDNPKVRAGDRIRYVIHISNGSDSDYVNVTVMDRVPAHTQFVLADQGIRPDASGLLIWTVPLIPAGLTVTLELQVRVADDLTGVDSIVNKATVNVGDALGDQPVRPADPLDPNMPSLTAGPNDPSSLLFVNKDEGFITWKTVRAPNGNPAVKAGEELLYKIYIENSGVVALTNISVLDTIPENATYVSSNGVYSPGSNSVHWTMADIPIGGKDSVSLTVKVTDDVTGITQIRNAAYVSTSDTMIVTGPCRGCLGLTVIPVEQGPAIVVELGFPNVFTPNGDGLNEYFKVRGLESYTGAELYIFNRWGNQVYASKDYKNDWNGNGLNEGTYYYLLRVKTSSEETKSFKGWVEILR